MKIGAVTLAYRDQDIIAGTLKCLKPFVDRHIVLISERPYFGERIPPDKTSEIAKDLGAEVISGFWNLDHTQRTLGNRLLKECDWVIGFDSDEMITGNDFEKLAGFLGKTKAKAVSVVPEVYWFNTDYRLSPKPHYDPIIAMKPDVKFTHIRNIDTPWIKWDGVMHHLSWCKPKNVLQKVTTYAHASDFNGAKWYEENYENWKSGNKVLMPNGEVFTAEFNPLPTELQEYLS